MCERITSGFLVRFLHLFTSKEMLLLYLTCLVASAIAFEQDLTVEVGAGKMECFFQNVKKAMDVEVEYQVSPPTEED